MEKVTKIHKRLHLSPKQLQAIQEIIKGKTDSEVAREVGVSRKTINHWRNDNPFFQAELNVCREEAFRAFVSNYQQLFEESFKTVKNAIAGGDVKTAKWFIEQLGPISAIKNRIQLEEPSGQKDPNVILKVRARQLAEMRVGEKPKTFEDLLPEVPGASNKKDGYINEDQIQKEAEKIFEELKSEALECQSEEEEADDAA